MSNKLCFAIKKDTYELVDPHNETLTSGLACDCICLICKKKLILKKGPIIEWHFAHESNVNCNWSNESILHAYAKLYIQEHKKIKMPVATINKPPFTELMFKDVKLEAPFSPENKTLRVDLLCMTTDNENIIIEITVTNKTDWQSRWEAGFKKGIELKLTVQDSNSAQSLHDYIETIVNNEDITTKTWRTPNHSDLLISLNNNYGSNITVMHDYSQNIQKPPTIEKVVKEYPEYKHMFCGWNGLLPWKETDITPNLCLTCTHKNTKLCALQYVVTP